MCSVSTLGTTSPLGIPGHNHPWAESDRNLIFHDPGLLFHPWAESPLDESTLADSEINPLFLRLPLYL